MSQNIGGDDPRKKEREVQREKRNIKVPNRLVSESLHILSFRKRKEVI